MDPPPEPRCTFVWALCGSDHVTRDAWAEWDVARQDWVLGSLFAYAYCHGCQNDVALYAVRLPGPSNDPAFPKLP